MLHARCVRVDAAAAGAASTQRATDYSVFEKRITAASAMRRLLLVWALPPTSMRLCLLAAATLVTAIGGLVGTAAAFDDELLTGE